MRRAQYLLCAIAVLLASCLPDSGSPTEALGGNSILVPSSPSFSTGLLNGGYVERRITTLPTPDWYPDVYGNLIVWQDWRNSSGSIYLYDWSTNTQRLIRTLSAEAPASARPSIWGNNVVWGERRPDGREDIYLVDLTTNVERRLSNLAYFNFGPTISGDKVVWFGGQYGDQTTDIYMYDLAANTEHQITSNPTAQLYPRISGQNIVWADWPTSKVPAHNVYLYDLNTGIERQITNHPTADQNSPDISGNRIVWQDNRNGDEDIYLFDLVTNTEQKLTPAGSDQREPKILGDIVVWEDWRHGNADVYLYEISSGTERRITTDPSNQIHIEMSVDRLVWQDARNGTYDIYLYAPPPVASINGPYNGVEATAITFSSAGSSDPVGRPLTYLWEFGDGTKSTAANPSKKYADNGTFAVKLTVTDPQGTVATALTSANVSNAAPTGAFGAPASMNEGSGYTLTFKPTDISGADKGTLQSWLDCGQGAGYQGPQTGTNLTQVCAVVADQDTVTVRARVRDKDGGETEYSRLVKVANVAPTVTLQATSPTSGQSGYSVTFNGSFGDPGVNDAPWSYTVTWGDGKKSTGNAGAPNATISLSHVYTKVGTWQAFLKVADKDGKSGTSTSITITVTP